MLIGLPLAASGALLLSGLLFRVSPWEPLVWGTATLALLFPVLLATILPARRAAMADPAAALREE